jgi:ADP-ribose pyrophosphatase
VAPKRPSKSKKARAKVLQSKLIYKGRVFELRHDRVSDPDGVLTERDIIVHPGSVVVLPVFPDGTALLIRQYRHAAGDYLWELVAGSMDKPGESPLAAAKRELMEEAGYAARRFRKMLDYFPSPGLISERMHIFLATDLTAGTAQPEDDERIEPRRFKWAEIDRMMQSGAIRDGKSLAGLLYYLRFIKPAKR